MFNSPQNLWATIFLTRKYSPKKKQKRKKRNASGTNPLNKKFPQKFFFRIVGFLHNELQFFKESLFFKELVIRLMVHHTFT